MDETFDATTPSRAKGGARKWFGILLLVAVLATAGWVYFTMESAKNELARVQDALKLQVLTSRLGVSAVEADYGNFEQSAEVVSGVFDGIQNYGIEHGSLPENFASVLERRDAVITMLVRSDPAAATELTALFYRLQIPVDTELDPRFIIPAADSGIGLAPPRRVVPDTAADSARMSDSSGVVAPDTAALPAGLGGQEVPKAPVDSMMP